MNRQVPHQRFLIIGRGRLATHLRHYLSLLNIPTHMWHRSLDTSMLMDMAENGENTRLHQRRQHSSFLMNADLRKTNACIFREACTPLAQRIHPLFSFAPTVYTLEDYQKFSSSELGGPHLSDLLPGLENPFFQIPKDQFALYHAYACSAKQHDGAVEVRHREVRKRTGTSFRSSQPYAEKPWLIFSRTRRTRSLGRGFEAMYRPSLKIFYPSTIRN